jgi:hypothetical protein
MEANNTIEVICRIIKNSSVNISDMIVPLVSVIVVGITSFFSIYLTNRANRNLSIYNKKKDELVSFSKLCGKYFGVSAILTSALEAKQKKSENTHYTDNIIRILSECKWQILSYLDVAKTKEACEKMEKLEDFAEELRQATIIQELYLKIDEQEKLQEQTDKISNEIKVKIYDVNHDLQRILIEQKQNMSNELDSFKLKRKPYLQY